MSSRPRQPVEPPLILALDVGTSSTRAILFDFYGQAIEGAVARQAYDIPTRPDGAVEIDADELLGHIWQCLDQLFFGLGSVAEQVAGVATCTFVGSVVGLDAQERPVTPLMTYADTRPAQDVQRLRLRLDEATAHQRTGCPFHSAYLPARFLWLEREHPDILKKAARWVSLGELMALHLFGEATVSFSAASWSGLLHRQSLDWDDETLAALPIKREQFSPLVDVDRPQRGLRSEFARRWPFLENVPWFPTISDGAAANLGSGCIDASRVAVTIGTTSAVRVVLKEQVGQVPAGLWCYRVDRERSLLGGALTEGGGLFAWLVRTLRLDDVEDLESTLSAMPPDGHGLTFLPLLGGERAPGYKAEARGVISGLSLATAPVQIVRAGMEGVAYRIGLVYRLLEPALPEDVQVIASGGALQHSPAWCQIVADVLGRPVTLAPVEEATGRGAALLALRSLGVLPGMEPVAEISGQVYKPGFERHEIYQQAIRRQEELYARIVA